MHSDNNLGDCNVIIIHQKRHFFYRSIFKSFIGRSTRLLIDNSSESEKSYILLGLSVYRHCQRKMGKEELSVFLESSANGEGFVFYSHQARPWCRWVLPSQTPHGGTGKSSALHLWMSVIWGPRPALYFLNPVWTENVFGLYCMTSPSLSKRSKRGRGWGLAF